MVMQKRIAWLILSVVAATSISIIIGTRHSSGEASVLRPGRTRIQVLRRNDRLSLTPTAREIQGEQPPPQERFLVDKMPTNVPIRVKIKKENEKAFKDSKSDKWARDFELEVKNTGTKPIYYLVLLINLPELRVGQSNLIFDLRFGDTKFANFATGARSVDLSLKPGKTIFMKIKDGNDLDWEDFSRGMLWPRPMRFELKFVELSFGDGTGFLSGGTPWPSPERKPGEGACWEVPNRNAGEAHHVRTSTKNDNEAGWKFSVGGEPASFLPARFLSAGFSSALLSHIGLSPAPDSCCSGDGCQVRTRI